MILFLDDWQRYPGAIVDYQTTNVSYLRQAQVYKQMGIKNHLFHLSLMQPELQGVDPFDPNLSIEQKAMIGIEARYNYWYYAREIARVPARAGQRPSPLRANRGNLAMFWLVCNSIDSSLIQPRQTGKSLSADNMSNWLIHLGTDHYDMMMITKDDALRAANIERLKNIRDNLPPYLLKRSPQDSDNQKGLTYKALNNSYNTGVSQNSENAANNLGRGLTTPFIQFDETPFIDYIDVTIPAAIASGTTARDLAAASGQVYGTLFTTTAGKKDSRSGKYIYNMIADSAVWTEIFFDAKNREQLVEMIRRNQSGKKVMVNITMSHRQLGYTDEWLYEKITDTIGTPEQAARDFLNQWTSGSQRSPLSNKLNGQILESEMETLYTEISREGYMVRWYYTEEELAVKMATGQYAIGLDTSEAVGRDAIAMIITDLEDMGTVAVGTFNETNLMRFAGFLANFLKKYENTVLIPEKKSSGQSIVDALLLILPSMGIDPFTRIFNHIVDCAKEDEVAYRELNVRLEVRSEAFYDKRKVKFGFNTSHTSRTLLYTTVLQNAAKTAGLKVRDKTLSGEIRGLVERKGRIDHDESGHDDHVIAWLLTHWFAHNARNLGHYGIDTRRVMTLVSVDGETVTEEDLEERAAMEARLVQIDDVLERLKDCRDPLVISKLEHRLRHLTDGIDVGGVYESMTVDAMLIQAEEERMKRLRIQTQQRTSTGSPAGHRPLNYNLNNPSRMTRPSFIR